MESIKEMNQEMQELSKMTTIATNEVKLLCKYINDTKKKKRSVIPNNFYKHR